MLKDYDQLNKLGQGSYGVVYKVKRRKDNKIFVLKKINISRMGSKAQTDAKNEVKILKRLQHFNIVTYEDSFIDAGYLNIIMEYCEKGDLGQLLKRKGGKGLPLKDVWKYFIQICRGIDYLHTKRILHRDIKTLNIFLTSDNTVRIGDLGVAKVINDVSFFAHTIIGTPFYLSPELCEERPYNEKSDIWALGCVLYELVTGRNPFRATNQAALAIKIIRARFDPIPKEYGPELSALVSACLTKDYRKRPSADSILRMECVKNKIVELGLDATDPPLENTLKITKPKTQDPSIKITKFDPPRPPPKPNSIFKKKPEIPPPFPKKKRLTDQEKIEKFLEKPKKKEAARIEGSVKLKSKLPFQEEEIEPVKDPPSLPPNKRVASNQLPLRPQPMNRVVVDNEVFAPICRQHKKVALEESPSKRASSKSKKESVFGKSKKEEPDPYRKPILFSEDDSLHFQNQQKLLSRTKEVARERQDNPPVVKELGYFKPMKMKPTKAIKVVDRQTEIKQKKESQKSEAIDLVKNLPGGSSSSEDDLYPAQSPNHYDEIEDNEEEEEKEDLCFIQQHEIGEFLEDEDDEVQENDPLEVQLKKELSRENKLSKVLEKNVKACESELGNDKLESILLYLMKMIEKEPQEDDVDRLDKDLKVNIGAIKPNTMMAIYRILHLRIILKESKTKIEELIPLVSL